MSQKHLILEEKSLKLWFTDSINAQLYGMLHQIKSTGNDNTNISGAEVKTITVLKMQFLPIFNKSIM